MAGASEPVLTNAQATDQLFLGIFRFLFEQNAIITWMHITICMGGIALIWWASRLDPDKLSGKSQYARFARDVIYSVKSGASAFLVSFLIGFVLFLLGLACEGIDGIYPPMVQLLTYMPTVVLGLVQLNATRTGVILIKKHTGL